MSVTKLIKAPIKLFRKDVITFLIIRRHDLGRNLEDRLRYVAVRPNASISVLRQKVWHLLDLPDYCEEVIVLKSAEDQQIPLTELRKGNNPHHPYILEVWLPEARLQSAPLTKRTNMLTLGNGESTAESNVSVVSEERDNNVNVAGTGNTAPASQPNKVMPLNSFNFMENKCLNLFGADYKKSNVTCAISTTSIFKMSGKKNRESFTNILLKIQSDLCTLSNKLSNLENRIPLER